MSSSYLNVIRTNLPLITNYCDMKPYTGEYDYTSLHAYMEEAEKILNKRGNKATLQADKAMSKLLREQGKDAVLQLKRANYNLSLKDWVTGASNNRMVDVIDEYIVPRTGLIFLTPNNKIGRAPFYSSEKVLGNWHIKTLWWNMAMMLLMCIATAILLFTDCPGRYLRKSES